MPANLGSDGNDSSWRSRAICSQQRRSAPPSYKSAAMCLHTLNTSPVQAHDHPHRSHTRFICPHHTHTRTTHTLTHAPTCTYEPTVIPRASPFSSCECRLLGEFPNTLALAAREHVGLCPRQTVRRFHGLATKRATCPTRMPGVGTRAGQQSCASFFWPVLLYWQQFYFLLDLLVTV